MGLEIQVVCRSEVKFDAAELFRQVGEIGSSMDVAVNAVGYMMGFHDLYHVGWISCLVKGGDNGALP